jgi:hypothetical protein
VIGAAESGFVCSCGIDRQLAGHYVSLLCWSPHIHRRKSPLLSTAVDNTPKCPITQFLEGTVHLVDRIVPALVDTEKTLSEMDTPYCLCHVKHDAFCGYLVNFMLNPVG